MFGVILKTTNSSFQKVMKLLAFIFEQPSYTLHSSESIDFCLFLLLYVPCQQLRSLRDGQFT